MSTVPLTPLPPPPPPLSPLPLPPPPMRDCEQRKNALMLMFYNVSMAQTKACSQLYDLYYVIMNGMRRNMNLIAELNSPCEINFGQIETAIYNALQTCNQHQMEFMGSHILTDIGAVNCMMQNALATITGLETLLMAYNTIAYNDLASALNLKTQISTWMDSTCVPNTYTKPTFNPAVWGA